jgi:hypothetical protein
VRAAADRGLSKLILLRSEGIASMNSNNLNLKKNE